MNCKHNDKIYVAKIKESNAATTNRTYEIELAFAVELICRDCGAHLTGTVYEIKKLTLPKGSE